MTGHHIFIAGIAVLLATPAAMAQTSRPVPPGARAPEAVRGRAVVNDRAGPRRPGTITATTPNASGNFGGPGSGGGNGSP